MTGEELNIKLRPVDEEEIGMLKSENAELKRDKEDLIFIRNQNAKCMCEDKENLTKAKELLKQWLQTSRASGCDNINIVTDTEQFISEVEK